MVLRWWLGWFLGFVLANSVVVNCSVQLGDEEPDQTSGWQRVVVLGDLHGDYVNTFSLLRASKIIDINGEWIALPDTLVVQVGDIVDRGYDSARIYALFRKLRRQAAAAEGKVINILGNHEVMNLCKRFNHVHPLELKHYGGSVIKMEHEWGVEGLLGEDIRKNFEVAANVDGVVFVHAGLLPKFASVPFDVLKERLIQQIDVEACPYVYYSPHSQKAAAWEITQPPEFSELDVLGELGPTWTRLLTTESEDIACPLLSKSLQLVGNGARMMVVGHTPSISGSIETRCNNRLVMVDTAISRFMGGKPKALLYNFGVWKELSYEPTTGKDEDGRVVNKVAPQTKVLFKDATSFLRRRTETKAVPTYHVSRRLRTRWNRPNHGPRL